MARGAICIGLFCALSGCTARGLEADAPPKPRAYHLRHIETRVDNPIALENGLPGTREWTLAQPATNDEIVGYADAVSATAGDSVSIFASTDAESTFSWTLYRMGYYGGTGGRKIASSREPAHIAPQEACPVDPATGLVECHWASTFQLPIDPSWVTGQYLIKLTREDGFDAYVPLVVREKTPRAPIFYHSNVTTWQAYNRWGGTSLYGNSLRGQGIFDEKRAARVSFDRPYEYQGAGHFLMWEQWTVSWLEMKGYDLAYGTNVDVDRDPTLLDNRTLFLEGGHDEYWSMGEREAVENARDAGLSLMFLSANDAFWRIRFDDSSTGQSRRIITCYKDAGTDPHKDSPDTTVEWRNSPFARPEDSLLGQMYDIFTDMDGFPLVVKTPDHWVYEGTGTRAGEAISHVIGNEWDHVFRHGNSPPDVEVLADSATVGAYGSTANANATVYYPTDSSLVFAAGTIQWPFGLSKPGYADARIQRITENVIARAGIEPLAVTVVPELGPPDDVGNAREVSVIAGTGEPGDADGPADQAQFNSPSGVAVGEDGTIYVTEARNHRIRKITTDGVVSTLAGCGPSDTTTTFKIKNGRGSHVQFDVPTGIAVSGDGTLYVSDAHSYVIRAVTPDGKVRTFAGNGDGGSNDDPDPLKAGFSYPRGLAFGPDGALYVADSYNSAIRRIDTTTGVTTVATGTRNASGVAVGEDGTIYVVSMGGNGVGIVKDGAIVPIVNVSGVAGDQGGDGATAMMRPADGIVVDGRRLVVSDTANYKVRSVALSDEHTVSTLAGNGRGGKGAGNGATANISNPRGIALGRGGYVVADSGNNRILFIKR